MADVFTWRATSSSTGEVKGRVRRTQFGDGYYQSIPDGLNHVSGTWQLQFVGTEEAVSPITQFIDAHIGRSFLWTPPLALQGLFQCDGYQTADNGGAVFTITATFTQAFEP